MRLILGALCVATCASMVSAQTYPEKSQPADSQHSTDRTVVIGLSVAGPSLVQLKVSDPQMAQATPPLAWSDQRASAFGYPLQALYTNGGGNPSSQRRCRDNVPTAPTTLQEASTRRRSICGRRDRSAGRVRIWCRRSAPVPFGPRVRPSSACRTPGTPSGSDRRRHRNSPAPAA
jgi:hypothetical protein